MGVMRENIPDHLLKVGMRFKFQNWKGAWAEIRGIRGDTLDVGFIRPTGEYHCSLEGSKNPFIYEYHRNGITDFWGKDSGQQYWFEYPYVTQYDYTDDKKQVTKDIWSL